MKKIFQFMLNKRVLPIVLVVSILSVFWAFQSHGENGKSLTNQQRILTSLGGIIEQNHYSPKPINDNFSKDIFKKFLGSVDPDKNIFLQSDISALKKYETALDDEIHGAPLQFLPAVNQVYAQRTQEVALLYKDILSKPFDYSTNEEIVTDSKKLNFSATEVGRKEMWKKKLKYLAL
ncbi:MAG: tail-specific protease, partial [Segetibacter sp.]